MSDQEHIDPIISNEMKNQATEEQTQTSENLAEPTLYDELLAQFNELQEKHAEVSDAYLRAKAETENVRRRGIEEEAKARKFAIEGFSKSLLAVKDSLEAALNTENQTFDALREGVQTTLKQLNGVFESHKVQEVAPVIGDKFDPNFHQAIAVIPTQSQEPNTIVEVLQKGYTLSERVLRSAMVTVSAK